MSGLVLLTLLGWGTALVLHVAHGRRAVRVARACHEVRGPLTAAGLALHAASRRGEVLVAVEAELGRAAAAVEDLFAAGAAPSRPVDVAALVRARVPAWDALADTLVVRLPDRPAVVDADPVRLAQAVGNLVANAVRHGAPPVELEVGSADGRVTIDVRDHGPGLPAPVEHLVARRSRGRHGHGLSVAWDAARGCGGTLVASAAGPGARLRLDLPVAPRPGTPDVVPTTPGGARSAVGCGPAAGRAEDAA